MKTWERFFRENRDLHEGIAIALASRRILDREIHYPKDCDLYKAFDMCEPTDVRVVILAQDPYHGPGEATGLAFSVPKTVNIPPSLKNIYKELKDDLNIEIPKHGDLTKWAKEGVFLLNSCLTVAKDKPGSHFDVGWQDLTDRAIKVLSDHGKKVFILWGKEAEKKKQFIDSSKNLVLISSHPSPFSVHKGFFGSKPFSKANNYLIEQGLKPIDWSIDD